MKSYHPLINALVTATFLLDVLFAQTIGSYTDADTGISFQTWTISDSSTTGGMVLGVALPEDALDVNSSDFIGYLVSNLITPSGKSYVSRANRKITEMLHTHQCRRRMVRNIYIRSHD